MANDMDPWREESRCVEETAQQRYDRLRDRFENELAECIHNGLRFLGMTPDEIKATFESYMSLAEYDPAGFRKGDD